MKLVEVTPQTNYEWQATYPTLWVGSFAAGNRGGEFRAYSETLKDFFEYDLHDNAHSQFTRTFPTQKLVWIVKIAPFGDSQIMVQMMHDFLEGVRPEIVALSGAATKLSVMFQNNWRHVQAAEKTGEHMAVFIK